MGFLDKATAAAKQAATDAKKAAADFQTANPNLMSGTLGGGAGGSAPADRLLRDLGVLTYLNAQGRPGSAEEYQRILGELQGLESTGRLDLALTSAYGPGGAPPPPPGAVRTAHEASQAPGASDFSPPPPPPSGPPTSSEPPSGQGTPPPPPPPPSWS